MWRQREREKNQEIEIFYCKCIFEFTMKNYSITKEEKIVTDKLTMPIKVLPQCT